MPDRNTNKERNKNRRKVLSKTIILLLLAFLLFIFATIAWFVMNPENTAGGMAVSPKELPFELEVRGPLVENYSLLSVLNTAVFGDDAGDYFSRGTVISEADSIYQTDGTHGRITWCKASNAGEADGHYDDGLEPDSCGKLHFWVVAKEDGTLDVQFDFGFKGFHAEYTSDNPPAVSKLFDIDRLEAGDDSGLTAEEIAVKKQALSFIKNHILFFKGYENGYYSGFCGSARTAKLSDFYSASELNLHAGDKREVTIYWKWANTLEQMVYSDASYYPLFAADNDEDREAVLEYICDTGNSVFKGNADVIRGYIYALKYGTEEEKRTAVFNLSNCYNDADQLVGDQIHYILFEMDAS